MEHRPGVKTRPDTGVPDETHRSASKERIADRHKPSVISLAPTLVPRRTTARPPERAAF
ncbi:hypothetical protein [Streptomyces soliscabiei]|uniref:hypothetical protein n=1 Tax=Streptomyces soliscabiei TaxID=588897 RepID=UPI0029A71AA2|nr:hypothetical protein [Streptomyces sp. NY05-11A]MDX2678074.1 hypothetical protein [Streptomyces sp. NY05-11A]